MGHIHLGVLPRSRKWRDVVALMDDGADVAAIAGAAARAADRDLAAAANDPVFVESLRLLAMIPAAARGKDFGDQLRRLDLDIRSDPDLIDIVAAVGQRLDAVGRGHAPTDFTELVRRTVSGTLSTAIGDSLPGLFEATATDVQAAARSLSSSVGFSGLARSFFTRLLNDTLRYWLDRASSTRTGPSRRFSDATARTAFDGAMSIHCAESTRIIREFAGGWYGKTLNREGEINTARAAAFGAVCFKKTLEELKVRSDD